MLRIVCDTCGVEFNLAVSRKGRKQVSCPSCGRMLDVELLIIKKSNPTFKVKRTATGIVLEPTKLSGKFRCIACAKVFFFEKGTSEKERYTRPHCHLCGSPDVVALTPLARAEVEPVKPLTKAKVKILRFIRRNYKALTEIRAYFDGMDNMIRRAALPKEVEDALIEEGNALVEKVLDTVLEVADSRLNKRMKELGLKDDDIGKISI